MSTLATYPASAHANTVPAPAVEPGRAWAIVYRLGAIAALAVLALMPVQMAVYFLWPPPTTVAGWFSQFQEAPLVGLMNLDLVLIVDYVLLAILFLGLFASLRRTHAGLAALFLLLELLAAATYFASAVAFEMLAASGLWATAATDVERTAALAVGQMLLLSWQGTAFSVSYVLAGAALLLAGMVMLRGGPFGRVTASAAVAAGAFGLIPATAGTVGLVASLLSLLPLTVWLIGTGRTLLTLDSSGGRR